MATTKLKPNPRDSASTLSKLFFFWLYPLLMDGAKRPLVTEDLTNSQDQDLSEKLGSLMKRNWEKEVELSKSKKRKPSYIRTIMHTFGGRYLFYSVIAFFEECVFKIAGPVFLGLLIRYFHNEPGYTDTIGYLLAAGIIISNFGVLMTHHPAFYGTQCVGMKIRIASCALIYQKALRLSTSALGQTTVGQLVNLLSNDVNRFDNSVIFTHYLVIGPLQTLICTYILWLEIGPSCLAGMSLVLLYVPLQTYMGKIFSKLRLETANLTDERVRSMNEMINAIRVIKMYAWERPFDALIQKARKSEISVIMKSNYFRAINLTLFFTSSKIVIFLSLLVYVLTGSVLTAEKVFVTSALINNIRLVMTLFFPYAISMGSEMLISCKRIQKFLEMEERDGPNTLPPSNLRPKSEHCSLEVSNLYARWDPRSGEDTLFGISFNVKAGEIMAVVGPVGSGKSSLLQCLLKELPLKKGSLNIRGRIAYASQEPWLFSGSVRDNILFGQPYYAKRYKEVLRVCALERDIELFSEGDQTSVGERGVSLSGGQKARINLARAVYFDADIYLLDDPLSAVDAHVGKSLFEQCISNFLRKKVVVLVTHQLQFIRTTNQILILKNGHVQAQGNYHQVKNCGLNIDEMIQEGEEEATPSKRYEEKEIVPFTKVNKLRRASEAWKALHKSDFNANAEIEFDNNSMMAHSIMASSLGSVYQDDLYMDDEPPEKNKEQTAESKSVGTVDGRVYLKYFLSGGGPIVVFLLAFSSILAQVLFTGSDYWLSYWTNNEQLQGTNTSELKNESLFLDPLEIGYETFQSEIEFSQQGRLFYVYIYTILTLLLLSVALVRTVLFFRMCMTSSRNLHRRMFAAVIRVPMNFFENHPIGQILNRFTKDVGQVDDILPPALFDYIVIFLNFFGIICMILYLNVWLLLPLGFLGVLFYVVRWIYLSSARDIKRLEGITRSPVFTHLSSTFQGLPTIRAFNAQQAMSTQFDYHQDLHTSSWFLFLCTSRLFGIYLDFLSSVFIAAVTISFMLNKDSLGGDVGLGISLAMMLSGMLQWGVRQSAEVESHMTSVERIIEYSKLEPEVSENANLVPKEAGWPSQGNISFQNVYLYYSQDAPPVLRNLTFDIDSAEKIGIVGRTGAGKSSLLSCLFRLAPPQGNILIDGVRTDILELEDLRKSLSIIPQEPTLFTGTVRYNLDPFEEYGDDKLWNALEEAQLKEPISEMNGQLNAKITEGGSNLSVGQRQLVCLARAILKQNKVLVMDEATANVDPQTDSFIQKTIREKFTDCTVLTIAHRLHTIMDSDRVIVMDAGQLEEFDSPHELLKNEKSTFSDLVNQTGEQTAQQLRKMAKEAYLSKRRIPSIEASFDSQDQENSKDESNHNTSKTDTDEVEVDVTDQGECTRL